MFTVCVKCITCFITKGELIQCYVSFLFLYQYLTRDLHGRLKPYKAGSPAQSLSSATINSDRYVRTRYCYFNSAYL